MNKRKHNEYFHVYVLASASRKDFVKVGKANNLKRVSELKSMGYAGILDWEQFATFPVDSNCAAIALEHMINAKLTNQGHKLPRSSWENRLNERASFADECFCCTVEHAISVASEMSSLYYDHIA